MGNSHCSFCSSSTNITHYSCKFKKYICKSCFNSIQYCYQCKQLTDNLMQYNNKLVCFQCIEELFVYKSHHCHMCNKTYMVRNIQHQYTNYCNECIENISNLCNKINKKLK